MIKASVILCNPQLWMNVGACARVMSNMDFTDLRLVNPRDKDILSKSYKTAPHAEHILDNAKIYPDLLSAISDLSFVIMTSGRNRDIEKKHCYIDELPDVFSQGLGRIGLVFGAERTGLTNEELTFADIVISLRTGVNNKSYNLSHAVGIVLYSLFSRFNKTPIPNKLDVATKKEVFFFLNNLEEYLDKTGYFRESDKKQGQSINLKNMFTRDYITKQDIKSLHRLLKHFKNQ